MNHCNTIQDDRQLALLISLPFIDYSNK